MALTDTGERRADLKSQLLERMHDPLQLRITVIGVVLLIGYCGVYMPLDARITSTRSQLAQEEKLAVLADNIEQLQKQCRTFEKRIPGEADSKEWVWIQYMQEGIRLFSLKLSRLDCLAPKKVGPYPVIVMSIELEGSYYELDRFLRWIESNPRLLRTDEISISLAAGDPKADGEKGAPVNKDNMVMRLSVLGLTG